jgi:hypothetical protein
MSYTQMVNAVKIPFGSAGSFFKDPNASVMSGSLDFQSRLSNIFPSDLGLGDSSPLDAMSNVTSAASSYTAEKLSKITVELPMMHSITTSAAAAAKKCAQLDSVIDASSGAAAIAQTFGPASNAPGCPAIGDAFKGLTTGVKDAVSGIENGVKTAFNAMSSGLKDTIKGAIGDFTDSNDMLTKLKNATAGQLSDLQSAMAGIGDELKTELSSIGDSLKSAAEGVKSAFEGVVAAEAGAINQAIDFMKSMNFVNMFGVSNPCVSEILNSVASPTVATHAAKTVAQSSATSFNTPTSNAIAQVNAKTELPYVGETSKKVPAPTNTTPNLYTQDEIDNFLQPTLNALIDAANAKKAESSTWLKANIEEWKVSVSYEAKRIAAGASESAPRGTTTDPAALATWHEVHDQFLVRRDTYRSTYYQPMVAVINKANDAQREFNLRKAYGKTPFTVVAQRNNVPLSSLSQTTYLDSGI